MTSAYSKFAQTIKSKKYSDCTWSRATGWKNYSPKRARDNFLFVLPSSFLYFLFLFLTRPWKCDTRFLRIFCFWCSGGGRCYYIYIISSCTWVPTLCYIKFEQDFLVRLPRLQPVQSSTSTHYHPRPHKYFNLYHRSDWSTMKSEEEIAYQYR